MKSFLKIKDHSVSKEEFTIYFDEEMQLYQTKPVPENLGAYYESENYISHTDASRSIVDKMYQWVKGYSLKKKVQLIKKLNSGSTGKLLDIGAGTGDFLIAAKNAGWSVVGIEPSIHAKERAKEKGLLLLSELSDLSKENTFDVITMWHVLEHVPNLDEYIIAIKSHLNNNGTLVVAVPNFNSYDASVYKSFWAAYDVPRHLWHFSQTSIQKLFGKHGMKVVNTLPMVFDSYYVSLLSEKYKTGSSNYIKAFATGLRSNLKAKRSGEYSSLIYVIKREN